MPEVALRSPPVDVGCGIGGANERGRVYLTGLRDSVEAFCGTLSIDSPGGQGTPNVAAIPVTPAAS